MKKILVYGYGNPGRQDDGLGARFIELIDDWIAGEKIQNIDTDTNYQLNVEDAATIADYDVVVFVDASVADIEDYKLEKVVPDNATIEFTMHAVSVAYVLDLCQKIYHKHPETFVLHIKAYEFEFIEELTAKAEKNHYAAFEFLKRFIQQT
ncbi:MAG TPA: hydrogenase maturation protease [Syntrophomonas sp.]|nr:hydrogenase maturation protease [Syntrophomonas sp.]